MVLSDSPRSCCSARKRLSSKAVSASQVHNAVGAEIPVQLLLIPLDGSWAAAHHVQLQQPLADQRLQRMQSTEGSDSVLATSPSIATAAVAAGGGATLGGRPGPRLSTAGDGITVSECHNGFWSFPQI